MTIIVIIGTTATKALIHCALSGVRPSTSDLEVLVTNCDYSVIVAVYVLIGSIVRILTEILPA